MEHPENRQKNPEEFDLAQFFRWIQLGLNRFGNAIIYGIASLRNLFFSNKLFFFILILIGLALGTFYSLLLKKEFYKTTMILSCDYLNNQIVESNIAKLNQLSAEPGGESLSELLGIDASTASNILRFESKPFVSDRDIVEMEVLREQLNNLAADKRDLVQKVMAKLTIENKNAYEISVYVYNPDIVKPLEKALINYFANSSYIKNRIEINHINLMNKKQKLKKESQKLDSLKGLLFENIEALARQPNRGSNSLVLKDEKGFNPLDVFKEDILINDEILDIEKKLYIKADFEVIEGFTTFKQPEGASLPEVLFISFWISWLMGYLIIGAWKFDKLLAKYSTSA
ncbi:hypothetical protein KK083_28680 [Fulvivirgaceae bacterium PWU4]|uniref:Polysaccharide chain length determinant N-terminal domain-containing protein n=1 Tax=Chryseosolibacter histidini TaxID=2782349 RepID=A0AAP2DTY8_9BACT|nr:hypothetical protein [Chryseosolibacter histidini]MBT1700902.1 hypothetical protein [Chryseosolibacter histidini]